MSLLVAAMLVEVRLGIGVREMGIVTLLMLQSAVPTAASPSPRILDFRLKSEREGQCRPDNSDDVIVCGSRDAGQRYRLQPLETARFEPDRKAETTLVGDLKGAAEVERKELGPGLVSSRIMFKLKLPF